MIRRALISLVLAGVIAAGAALAAPRLDPTFGGDGRVTTNIDSTVMKNRGNGAGIMEFAVDSRGRAFVIVDSGYRWNPRILFKLRADGDIDKEFSADGRMKLRAGSLVVPGRRGTFLLAGSIGRGNPGADAFVRKYTAKGLPDRSFGNRGTFRVDLGMAEGVSAVFRQPSGNIAIFVSGYCDSSSPNCGGYTHSEISVLILGPRGNRRHTRRINTDRISGIAMAPDGSFAAVGSNEDGSRDVRLRIDSLGRTTRRIEVAPGSLYGPHSQALQSDGRIVSTGDHRIAPPPGEGMPFYRLQKDDLTEDPTFDGEAPCQYQDSSYSFIEVLPGDAILGSGVCGIVRLTPDGSPDESFSGDGLVQPGVTPWAAGGPNGTVVFASWDLGGQIEVGRLFANGEYDADYGDDGTARLAYRARTHDWAQASALTKRGLVVAGGVLCADGGCAGFALARYRRDGRLDRSFGGDGRVATLDRGLGIATAVVANSDGSLVVGGPAAEDANRTDPIALAKYLPSGQLDKRFGTGGIVRSQFSDRQRGRTAIYGLAVQKDGKLIAVGHTDGCSHPLGGCFLVARYRSDGSLDEDFADGGVLLLDEELGGRTIAYAAAIQRNGRIVVTGSRPGKAVTVRLMADGRLDPSFGAGGVVVTPTKYRYPSRAIDLSRGPRALALGRNGSITVAGGGADSTGLGFVFRYRPDGSLDRSFARRGRFSMPAISLQAVRLGPCSIIAAGAVPSPGGPRPGLVVIPRNGRGKAPVVRYPWGRAVQGVGDALSRLGRGRIALVGGIRASESDRDFGVAAYSRRAVSRCG